MLTKSSLALPLMLATFLAGCSSESVTVDQPIAAKHVSNEDEVDNDTAASDTAILGGGCFWCVESDFEKCHGVTDVVSGYSGGSSKNPTYENYAAGGQIEVVKVTYDPSKITFAGLVEWLIKHSDPTDPNGSFADRGPQYRPVVFYSDEQQQQAAEKVIKDVDKMGVYDKPIAIDIEPRQKFWPAENYHQDYHKKSFVKYDFYRYRSGRDAFIAKHWGDRAGKLELPESKLPTTETASRRQVQQADSGQHVADAPD